MTHRPDPHAPNELSGRSLNGTGPDFRVVPSVDQLLRQLAHYGGSDLSDSTAVALIADVLARAREEIANGLPLSRESIVERARIALRDVDTPRLTSVINATGIVIHTNLGRAPVSEATAAAMAQAAASYVPLELDPATNQRGGRMAEVSRLMNLLTGAEATLVVNNNAAAVLLSLSAVAAGKQVVVSRGEAVEIGGGFRIPDVLRQSGADLVEVGTTNRTYIQDYRAAIGSETAGLLKVHPSNFRMVGFTAAPALADLVALGAETALPVLEDLGSGTLLDTAPYGVGHEPTLQESIAAGVSVVMASGDKLLGGPQAGLLLGHRRWIDQLARHPLARAVRADKTGLAGLAATLRHYLRGESEREIPVWRMMAASTDTLRARVERVRAALAGTTLNPTVVESESSVGGGSLPGQTLPSVALRIEPRATTNVDELSRRLRTECSPPVFGRILDGGLQLDLRTVLPEHDYQMQESLRSVAASIAAE